MYFANIKFFDSQRTWIVRILYCGGNNADLRSIKIVMNVLVQEDKEWQWAGSSAYSLWHRVLSHCEQRRRFRWKIRSAGQMFSERACAAHVRSANKNKSANWLIPQAFVCVDFTCGRFSGGKTKKTNQATRPPTALVLEELWKFSYFLAFSKNVPNVLVQREWNVIMILLAIIRFYYMVLVWAVT